MLLNKLAQKLPSKDIVSQPYRTIFVSRMVSCWVLRIQIHSHNASLLDFAFSLLRLPVICPDAMTTQAAVHNFRKWDPTKRPPPVVQGHLPITERASARSGFSYAILFHISSYCPLNHASCLPSKLLFSGSLCPRKSSPRKPPMAARVMAVSLFLLMRPLAF